MNMNSSQRLDKESGHTISCVSCYFMCQDGSMFKAQVDFAPYFYIIVKEGMESEVDSLVRRKLEGGLRDSVILDREDLDLKNHLSGIQRKLLKLTFYNIDEMMLAKKEFYPVVARNKARGDVTSAYALLHEQQEQRSGRDRFQDAMEGIIEMREHDVPYHVRFAIDTDVRCGHWFTVSAKGGSVSLVRREDLLQRAEPRICAFDIETTKLPLQFPNAEHDQVFMISYMIDKKGYLIINREVVGDDVRDFEYTPKPEFEGPFKIFNCANEAASLRKWFDHMREVKPGIYVTYNGDFFDWPFIQTRAAKHGMNMAAEIGFMSDKNSTLSRSAVHMDCLHWVNRDSYLPQGSRGLKAVTKSKLGYDPVEVDPEDMVRLAAETPQDMASYSVSDAVCTYYLYMTYIHPFIFSLSTIIPMNPDEVLRKGSGTLCEMLLMVQAYQANIVAPNKHTSVAEKMFRGHLLESETYIGGKVEALESGVFRSDLPCKFRCRPEAYQALIDKLDADLTYALTNEGRMEVSDVVNYEEVKAEIMHRLENLRDNPIRNEEPLIYHLDVAAMYPNIILTNRLQPSSIVNDEDCAACDFNRPGKTCLREMEWVWRGENYSATRAEYIAIKSQLESETFAPETSAGPQRLWTDLSRDERARVLKDRLKRYCQKVYKRVLDKPVTEKRMAGICQRENSFYVDTVRAFRDRRYEYKGLTKVWKGKLEEAKSSGNLLKVAEAGDMCVLYDSLQLAHKCILNSFYGYVMRKGARWYSMEMAGVVTHTGANIIKKANELIGQVGRPLELDTDGIWCALPKSFPEEFKLRNSSGKVFKMSYPCAMLNVMLADNNTNNQYATLVDSKTREYLTSHEMSIEFEVDGPYRAMILPASKEEGKLIKKRYAVFNFDGTLAELKGFELKRRGELKLIKVFQGEVFDQFLKGDTLEECYKAVGTVANRWLDMLDTRGSDLTDDELLDHISETCVMSKSLEEYEGRKSCATTCAARLAQFLGDDRIRDKGLVCNYVIARSPPNQPTSGRAIPVAIFSTEPAVARTFLRRWCGGDIGRSDDLSNVPDVRDIVDWEYYKERLGSAVQKIITIPAAMQRIQNPVPRVKHPDWLHRKVAEKGDTQKQAKVDVLFAKRGAVVGDVEDIGLQAHIVSPGTTVGLATVVEVTPGNSLAQDILNKENADADLNTDVIVPLRSDTYAGWLLAKKQIWKQSRIDRKRKMSMQGGKSSRRVRITNVVGDMFRAQANAAGLAYWHIVAITATLEPGLYKAWAVIGGRMHSIPLRISRRLFVDTAYPPDSPQVDGLGTLVKRIIPGSAESGYLYQLVLDEKEYREHLGDLETRLSRPGIRGVYEAKLDPCWSAALTVGCVATLSQSALGRPLGVGFDVTELVARPVLEGGYFLEPGDLRHLCLHVSEDAGNGRCFIALHLPFDNNLKVWIVHSARSGQREISTTSLQRCWEEAIVTLKEVQAEDTEIEESVPTMEVHYARSQVLAYKAVQKQLMRIRDRALGPTVLLLDAADPDHLPHFLSVLGELPVVAMSTHSSLSAYPALGWQLPAVSQATHRILGAGSWLLGRLQAAQYSHLPLSAFGSDWVIDACDALYARQLRDAGHLLWAQDHGQPDIIYRAGNLADNLTLGETQSALELSYPGVHRCVCVEIKINHLAVCAVLEAGLLGELEGAALIEDQQGCGPAFRVLRTLAQHWMEDATRRSNIAADTLLRNMYRWICSTASKLHDPTLQRFVQSLMKKLLVQLVSELGRLGAQVVHADSCSLVLATGKRNVSAALGYVDYILETLSKRELFQHLSLAPARFWHTLLFADRYNYIGVEASLPTELSQTLIEQRGELQRNGSLMERFASVLEPGKMELERPRLDCIFTLKDHLPRILQDLFMSTVTEFLWLPWKEGAAMSTAIKGATQGGSPAARDACQAAEAQTNWLKSALPAYFTEKLLRQVTWISLKVGAHDGNEDHSFPKLSGSHLSNADVGSPALAFVKNISYIMALDSAVSSEVTVLRRQLLKLVHCKEFSPESEWKDPCISLVLPDVICAKCQNCQDLDLCRDPFLQQHDWRCQNCGEDRNVEEIEAALVSLLNQKSDSYELQDLRCIKCSSVATEHLQKTCDLCGAQMKGVLAPETAHGMFSVFASVAEFHNLQTLKELACWHLNQNIMS